MNGKLLAIALLVCWAATGGCYYDSEEALYGVDNAPCDTTAVTYSTTVVGLLSSYGCYGCHVGPFPSGQVSLQGHDNLAVVAQNGRLLGAIRHAPGYAAMPQGGIKMSACDINKIRAWVDAGAPNN